MSKIRVGIIGVGGIAQGHIARLDKVEGVEIVAICDTRDETLEGTRERHGEIVAGAKSFADYRDLLETTRPDAVVICTPHTLHYAQAVDALDSGAHVLLEKPMVCRVADARALIRKVDETKKVLGLAYQRHVSPQFRFIRDQIASGVTGPVQAFNAIQQQGWKKATVGSWRQDPALSGGGQINDSGSHLLDVILWVTGLAPEKVSAFIDNKGTPVDINSSVNVQFVGGATGTFTIVGDAPQWWEDVTIWCENAAFYIRNGGEFTMQHADGSFTKPDESLLPPLPDIDANFINAIRGTEPIAAPPVCGLRTIELTEAAWESGAANGALTIVKRSE